MAALPFEDSRRLTGANPYFSGAGVALEVADGVPLSETRLLAWREHVTTMLKALGWPLGVVMARRHAGGASLVFEAPEDSLYAATEVNEWAWGSACDISVGEAPGHPAVWDGGLAAASLRALVAAEASPALLALLGEARRRGVPALPGEDLLTLGSGAGGKDYVLEALPAPAQVPWQDLHAVPTALVTGSNGKTTTVRLLAAMLHAAGRRSGFCCTDGLFIDGAKVDEGDYSGPIGARTVLRQKNIDAAVLETARGGLLRRGLAPPHADVAVVTNVSVDHFGEYGVHTLEDLARVKLAVARVIDATGLLVVNAEDPLLREMAPETGAPLGWFSLDHASLFLRQHAVGRPVCVLQDGHLRLYPEGMDAAGVDLGSVADMPLSMGGAARYNIANLAAASLAAWALGVASGDIAATLTHFGRDNADNRGRLERWDIGGVRVLLDYAHNADGVAGLLDIATAKRDGGRLAMTLGHVGNRLDKDIRDVARTAARYAPDRVVLKHIKGYERGREAGEIIGLLHAALLEGGIADAAIDVIPDEVTAAHVLLDWARPGDVLVLLIHQMDSREQLVALLDDKAAGSAPAG